MLFGIIHSKLTVSYIIVTHSTTYYIPRNTSSSLVVTMSATDHINGVLLKSAYSLMSRVSTSSNSIVTTIVNNDAYQMSLLMNNLESMFYV